jgi:hypothetical protein
VDTWLALPPSSFTWCATARIRFHAPVPSARTPPTHMCTPPPPSPSDRN